MREIEFLRTEQFRTNLFAIYIEFAEQERKVYKKIHDDHVQKFFSFQHSLNNMEKLSPEMSSLIHERCTKISERIQCIYIFKKQPFVLKT